MSAPRPGSGSIPLRPAGTEVHSLDELDELLGSGRGLAGIRLQGLDLTQREDALLAVDPLGAVVLGGRLTPALEHHLRVGGAVLFPVVHDCPVDSYRATLYRPEDLYAGLEDGYAATPDARAYDWLQDGRIRHDTLVTLQRAIHDDAITDALDELLTGRHCVAVMGGHALERGSTQFAEGARLGRDLARAGCLVLTGGGPGAMEAVNLGARLSQADDAALDDALDRLGAVPSFRPDPGAWVRVAMEIRADHPAPEPVASVGIPTWFYGHEPPNALACVIAKYFSNAVREDTLLARANGGVVFLPGAAGTVQELFQAVTPGYYSTTGGVPLVLVDRARWVDQLPAWQLVNALARGRALSDQLVLVDEPSDVPAALGLAST